MLLIVAEVIISYLRVAVFVIVASLYLYYYLDSQKRASFLVLSLLFVFLGVNQLLRTAELFELASMGSMYAVTPTLLLLLWTLTRELRRK